MLELEAHLRAHPDDLAAWTVYADWLLEQGDVRGMLVRQTRTLTTQEIEAWRGPVPQPLVTAWRHGFITELDVPLDPRAIAMIERVLADRTGRFVTRMTLRPSTWRDRDPWDEPAPERVEGLDVLCAILALDLRQLRALGVTHVRLTDAQVTALASARLAVVDLDLRYCALTDAHLARLAAAPWFAGVQRLHLHRNEIEQPAPLARHFELLDVRYTGITEPLDAETVYSYAPNRTFAGSEAAPRERPIYIDGLSISSQPTSRFTLPRFVPKEQLTRSIARDCERVPGLPHLRKVYVDPDEWTFRSFENIVPLDRRLAVPELALVDHAEIAHEVHRFRLDGELPAFDQLPLYTRPLNAASRGGQRYIFHSAKLASALTDAVRRALPSLKRFSHVNPVFRCNRFEPGDEPFHRHRDTPYFDTARNHISEYTLLLYLTGGTGEPALSIEGHRITTIDPHTCFVFHQAYEHAGRAYTDGRKVFLRTELVFDAKDVAHDPRIAALFAKACYYTGESVRTPALARDADRAYNRVAAAHWGAPLADEAGPLVHKQFRGIHWLANGYDFWFPRDLPLADCAALTLLDYFNCAIDGAAMRSLVTSEVVPAADPDAFLAARSASALPTLDKAMLFPAPETRMQNCCPGHGGVDERFDATVCDDVVDIYRRAQRFARDRIAAAPIMMLGQQIYLDPDRFVVDADKIHVLSADRLAPVNFAACWNCPTGPRNYLHVDVDVAVVQPLVPPILWEATPGTHHLMFDFFRNSWAATVKQYRVPVPRIAVLNPLYVDEDDEPWFAAAEHANPRTDLPPPAYTPFHTRGGLLAFELYRDEE